MIALVLIGLLTAAPEPDPARAPTAAAMHAAFQGIVSLQPALASPEAFRDPANAPTIAAALLPLRNLKHRFAAPREPGLEVLSGLFAEAVERARLDLKTGNAEAARMRLRAVSSLCLACHTRESATKDFEDAAHQVEGLILAPLSKAEFFATTRQFDRAIEVWNRALDTPPKNEADAFEQASALRQYVAVLVRVKDDRAATVALLTKQAGRKALPVFIAHTLQRWLVDAKYWQADDFDARTAAPEALFARASAIIESSGAAGSPLADEGRFISIVRAGAYLHAALERLPRAPYRGEALYLLGVVSAATVDPQLWELDSLYLEECVRENPHSAIAVRCVDRMYERVWFGWTGSGGTSIPADLSRRLGELRALAQP